MSGNHKGKYTTSHIQTRYMICANMNVAIRIAIYMHEEKILPVYETSLACLEAYEAYPLPLRSRYHPYAACMNTKTGEVLFVDNLLEVKEYINA